MERINLETVTYFLQNNELAYHPTQNKISFPLLERIFNRLKAGNRFSPIQIDEQSLIDGHHRFVCLSMLDLSVETVNVINSGRAINKWAEVQVEIRDWDSEEERDEYSRRYDNS